MQGPITTKTKVFITGIITLFIFGVLLWEYFNGGVPSHHMLHDEELPAISNWWGGLLLPVLTWVLLGRIEKRLKKKAKESVQSKSPIPKVLVIFTIGLIFGILIAVSFVNDYNFILDYVLYAILVLSLLVPIFYAEFILGFVLGMTITLGAILPTIFILIMASLGFLIYRFIRPLILRLTGLFSNNPS